MKPTFRIHIAGPRNRDKQDCTRCGVELAREPLSMWTVGHRIAEEIGGPSWVDRDAGFGYTGENDSECKASRSVAELWRGNQKCKCGWMLPRESQFDVILNCEANQTVKHNFTMVMYCPECGEAYELPTDEMKILLTQ